jgi:hypothetical protein
MRFAIIMKMENGKLWKAGSRSSRMPHHWNKDSTLPPRLPVMSLANQMPMEIMSEKHRIGPQRKAACHR